MSERKRRYKPKKKRKLYGLVFVLLLFLIIGAAGGAVAYYYNTYVDIDRIYPGISIGDMDVSNLTLAEAQKLVDDYVARVEQETVTLEAGKKKESLTMSDLGLTWTNPEVVQEAYDLGKSGNVYERIKTVYGLRTLHKYYPIILSFQEDQARKKIIALEKTYLAKKKDATIKRKDGKFVVTKEVNGLDMDLNKNADNLMALLTADNWDRKSIVFPLEYKEDKAKVTKAQLSVIKDKLGSFTTSYAGSAEGRCANVENGASLINKTLLFPGDVFSVHDAVTPFTKENGYRLAGSYEDGTTVQTYGGGICQVSTTLYNAVLRAELRIKERDNHSMTVHYVDLSEDAAISGDVKDFKFQNNLNDPIYIFGATDHDNRTITFTIYGKEYRDKDRSIEFVSECLTTIPPKEEKIKDKTLPKGKKVVEKQGHTGYTARLIKVIHQKGKEDIREQINSSYYMSTPRVVRVGTKEKKKDDKTKEDKTKETQAEDSQDKQEEKTEGSQEKQEEKKTE